MGTKRWMFLMLSLVGFFLAGCSKNGSASIFDSVLGAGSVPALSSFSTQLVTQGSVLKLDFNNLQSGGEGNDKDMTYTCYYDDKVDGVVDTSKTCDQIPLATVTFGAKDGIFEASPGLTMLGNYEIKVSGKNDGGMGHSIFVMSVRLKFDGVTSISAITGNSAQLEWTPHTQALGYQIKLLNDLTGLYEVVKSISDGTSWSTVLTGLQPNKGYSVRIEAIDALGNLDGNVVTQYFTTTDLVRFDISTASSMVPAGTPVTITIRAKNSDNSPQTIGGIPLVCSIGSGSATGTFSAVTDNHDGTYTVQFTPALVGTPVSVALVTNVNFNIDTQVSISVVPGAPAPSQSAFTVAQSSVSANSLVALTATLKDSFGNSILSGRTVSFSFSGGVSTGSFSAVTNNGDGTYSSQFRGMTAGAATTLRLNVDGSPLGSLSQSMQVVPGTPVSANSTMAVASPTVVSGTSTTVTAVLRDIYNNLVSAGLVVTFNKTGGTSSGDYASSVTNAGNGTYTTTYTGMTAGTAQTLSVSVNGVALTPTANLAVVAGAPSGPQSLFTVSNSTVSSGGFVSVTATLRDANSNPIIGGTITFDKTGGTSTGTFSSVNNGGNGVYSVQYTGVTSGTAQTLRVLHNGTVVSGLSGSIQVLPGGPSLANSSMSISSSTVSSGQSVILTAQIRDSNNNPISTGISVGFAKAGGTSTGVFGTISNDGSGQYSIPYTGLTAGTAQTVNLIVDGFPLGLSRTVTVVPGPPSADFSSITVSNPTVVAGQNVVVRTAIRDANNNPITSGILVSFDAMGGTSTGVFSTTTNEGNGLYSATFMGVISGTAKSLNANINGSAFGNNVSLQVLTGPPSTLTSTISVPSSTVRSHESILVTATIKDSQGNAVNSGITLAFTKTSGTSTGTFDGTVVTGSGGIYTTNYTGVVAGTPQTLSLSVDGNPLAISTFLSVTPGIPVVANSGITVSAPTVAVGQSVTVTGTLRDFNSNLIPSGYTVGFSKAGGTSTGTLSAVTNGGNGTYTATYTGTAKGTSQTLSLLVGGSAFGPTVPLTVTAGPPHHLAITTAPSSTQNMRCEGPYTITIQDAANVPTSQSTSMAITFTSTGNHQTGTIFSDSNCLNSLTSNTTSMTSLEIPALAETAQFYFMSVSPKTFTLNITSSEASVAATAQSFATVPVLAWLGAGGPFSATASGSNIVSSDMRGMMEPFDVAANGGNIYVTDFFAGRIIRYNSSLVMTGWLGAVGNTEGMTCESGTPTVGNFTPSWCMGGHPLATTASLLTNVKNITFSGTYMYVTQSHYVLRFNTSSGVYAGWIGLNGTGTACGAASTVISNWCTAQPTNAQVSGASSALLGGFNGPTGIRYARVDGTEYLFIADVGNNRIVRVLLDGSSPAWIGNIGTTAPTLPAGCNGSAQGAVTPTWCTNGLSQRAQRINLSGSPPTLPGEGFYGPQSMDFDHSGGDDVTGDYMYVADSSNARMTRWNIRTGAFAGWVGLVTNESLSQVTGGTTTNNYPNTWISSAATGTNTGSRGFGTIYKIRTDSTYIYFGDSYHRVGRLRKSDGGGFQWAGRVGTPPTGGSSGCASTAVGSPTPGWCSGGGGNRYGISNLAFHDPRGLELVGSQLFIADRYNYRVQRINTSSGLFESWMGAVRNALNGWRKDEIEAARGGYDDSSFGHQVQSYVMGITNGGGALVVADQAWHRLKKYTTSSGVYEGYIGTFVNNNPYSPVAPDDCVGITSGMTPTWCQGGGRTAASSGVNGFNNPSGLASDGTYLYVANLSNNRIDKILISDASYIGWVGKISTTPNDGPDNCSTTVAPNYTPNWCTGGTGDTGSTHGAYENVRSLYYDSLSSLLFVTDGRGRLSKLSTTNGAVLGSTGSISSGSTGCNVTSSSAQGWCNGSVAAANNGSYGRINAGQGIGADATYVYVVDVSHRILRFNKSSGAPAGFIAGLTGSSNLSITGACADTAWGLKAYPKVTPGWCVTNSLGQAANHTATSLEGGLNDPRGIYVADGYIYVLDSGNHRINRYLADGTFQGWKGQVLTAPTDGEVGCTNYVPGDIAKLWCKGGSVSASTRLGGFDTPTGMTGDGYYLYVFDPRNNRIQAVPR